MLLGDTYAIQIKNKIPNAKYKWKSSDKSIATVNDKGIVKGLKKGTITITCDIQLAKKKYSLKCNVSVKNPAKEIIISNKIDYLLVGAIYDLNRTLEPIGSNDLTTWKSSDKSVIDPNKSGRFLAKKEGIATITATTLSKKSDSVTIYVVKTRSEIITKDDVVDGKVILKKESYGDLIISNSVGDALIELDHVIVGGSLTMEAGAAYTVMTKDCNINNVEVVKKTEVESFAISDSSDIETAPAFIAGKGSFVVSIDSECNVSVKQSGGASIQSFNVATKEDGAIAIHLEGFNGDLMIDSQTSSSIRIETTSCQMTSATVRSAHQGQEILLRDTSPGTEKASSIHTVNMNANVVLTVDVKAEEVKVAKEVFEGEIVISQPTSKVINEGNNISLELNSQIETMTSAGNNSVITLKDIANVQSLTVEGAGNSIEVRKGAQLSSVTTTASQTKVMVFEGATVQKVTAYGNDAIVEGKGVVQEAIITGNNSQVNTKGTAVQVAIGTSNVTIGGIEVKEEDKVPIEIPTPSPQPTQKPANTTVTPTPTPVIVPSNPPVVQPPYIPSNPTPTTVPVATPTVIPKPTTTPVATPTVTPVPSNTPQPTEEEKLAEYNDTLLKLKEASISCLENNSSESRSAVKVTIQELTNRLNTFGDMDPEFSEIELQDSYLYDFAEYFEVLVTRGQEFGGPIRIYYEKINSGTETLEQAIAAANRTMVTVDRINKETPMFVEDVRGVFLSLEERPEEFCIALNQLIKDADEYAEFRMEETSYYQLRLYERITRDELISGLYESQKDLTFWEAINCFLGINRFYGEEQRALTNSALYKELMDQVIDQMPDLTAITRTDDSGTVRLDHVEFVAPTDYTDFLNALGQIFERVNLQDFMGEDITEFHINPDHAKVIMNTVAWQMSDFTPHEDGYIEALYRYNEFYSTMNPIQQVQVLNECIGNMLWSIYNHHQWSEWYLNEYGDIVDEMIEAADNNDSDLLYQRLVTLYEKKLNENDHTKVEWSYYAKPMDEQGATIDKNDYLELIKSKLLPLSEVINEIPTNSRLYNYMINRVTATGELLDEAIYEFVDAVDCCQKEMLHSVLDEMHAASGNCVLDNSEPNRLVIKTVINKLKQSLKRIGALDPAYEEVEVMDQYLFDYGEYFKKLAVQGANYGGPIRQYYENKEGGYVSIEQAIDAANRTLDMVGRINVETEFFAINVNAVFATLQGDLDEFFAAMDQLITDAGDVPHFAPEQAEYYQSRIRIRILEDEYTRSHYEAGEVHNFLPAISCFISIIGAYEEARLSIENEALYDQLVNGFIGAMPELMVHTRTDESGAHYDYVEYDLDANHDEVLNAINALFAGVNLRDFFGEDMSAYMVKPQYITQFIEDLARQLSYYETYEDGTYEILNYYIRNKDSLNLDEKPIVLKDCAAAILWTVYNIQNWNDNNIDNYKPIVDEIIEGVNQNNAEVVYGGLITMFDRKRSEGGYTGQEWWNYEAPADENGALIDKEYYLTILKIKLQPLSEMVDGVPCNSRLYDYLQGDGAMSAQRLEGAIYELKDLVWEANLWSVNTYNREKDMIQSFMEAIQNNDMEQLYTMLSSVNDYFNLELGINSTILGMEYAQTYLNQYTGWVNSGDFNSGLVLYYERYLNNPEEGYSREIADVLHRAIFEAQYYLTEEGRGYIEEEYQRASINETSSDILLP
jgi:hypothetical protein